MTTSTSRKFSLSSSSLSCSSPSSTSSSSSLVQWPYSSTSGQTAGGAAAAVGPGCSSSSSSVTSSHTTSIKPPPTFNKSRIGHILADRLQITGVIGSGPYSVVYSAFDFSTTETVALKVIPKKAGNVSITFPNRDFGHCAISKSGKPSAAPNKEVPRVEPEPEHELDFEHQGQKGLGRDYGKSHKSYSKSYKSQIICSASSKGASATAADRLRPHSMMESSTAYTKINAVSLGLHEVFRRYDYLISCGLFDSKCPLHIAYREVALHGKACQACPSLVVGINVVFECDNYLYVAMEYCPAGDLFHAITDLKLYLGNEAKIKNTFLQLLNIVELCHELNIYHCDLKPENVLLNKYGSKIKLADFGLATSNPVCTDYGCGSSFYMSPERLTRSNSHDNKTLEGFSSAASDIWALGIILLNLTCGRNPWKKASIYEDASYRAFVKDANFLENIMPVTPQFNQILVRIFDIDPRNRLTLSALRDEIMSCPRLTTLAAPSSSVSSASATPVLSSVTGVGAPSSASRLRNSRNISSSSLTSVHSEDQEPSTPSTSPNIDSATSTTQQPKTHYYHHKLQAYLQEPNNNANNINSSFRISQKQTNFSPVPPSPIAVPSNAFEPLSIGCYASSPPLSNESPNMIGAEAFLQSPTPMTPGKASPMVSVGVPFPLSPVPATNASLTGLLPALPVRQHIQTGHGHGHGHGNSHSYQSRWHHRSNLASGSHPYSRPSPRMGGLLKSPPRGATSPPSHTFFSPHVNMPTNSAFTSTSTSTSTSTFASTSTGLGLSSSPYSASFVSPLTPQALCISDSSLSCSASRKFASIYPLYQETATAKYKKRKSLPSLQLSPLS